MFGGGQEIAEEILEREREMIEFEIERLHQRLAELEEVGVGP